MTTAVPAALRATLLGASGMVGIEVLHACLAEPRIGELTALVRRPLAVQHARLRQVVHTDYTDYGGLEDILRATDVWFHCIGVYQGMVPEAEFYRVTCDFLAALLRDLEAVRTDTTFCLFSAQGADPAERSRVLFRKAKGRAERLLRESKIRRQFVFRPGYIDPGRQSARSRIPVWLARPFYRLVPAVGIGAPELARVMVRVGVGGGGPPVWENRDLRRAARVLA